MENTQNYEEFILNKTKEKFQNILQDKTGDPLEQKAVSFYLDYINNMNTVPNERKFKKPGWGVGGTGDEEIRAPYVVRDFKTHQPLLKNGELVVIKCVFTSFDDYMDIISSQKANCLRLVAGRGAYPVNEEDKKYVQPDPFAWIYNKNDGYD